MPVPMLMARVRAPPAARFKVVAALPIEREVVVVSKATTVAWSETSVVPPVSLRVVVDKLRVPSVSLSIFSRLVKVMSPPVPEKVRPVVPAIVKLPAPVRLVPMAVKAVTPPGERTTLPVVALPRVKLCMAVVPRIPVAVRVLAPAAPADTVAVGVPLLILRKPALAEEVALAPTKRSQVSLRGERVPRFDLQFELPPPPAPQVCHSKISPVS